MRFGKKRREKIYTNSGKSDGSIEVLETKVLEEETDQKRMEEKKRKID
jgi:hypothetical protein